MIRYRIYTENKNQDHIMKLTSQKFDSYTMLTGTGCYKGEKEPCLIIEILTIGQWKHINELVEEIKEFNKQKEIIFTVETIITKRR